MKKLTILVDMDSTIVNLCDEWYRQYNESHGDDLTIDKVLSWSTHKYAKAGHKVYDIISKEGFYAGLPPIPGALEAMHKLHADGHRLVIVTASPPNNRTASWEKKNWVSKHLPFLTHKDVVDTHAKDVIRGDVLLDDGPHNIKAFREAYPHAYIAGIYYPFNNEALGDADLLAHGHRDYEGAWELILSGVRRRAKELGK